MRSKLLVENSVQQKKLILIEPTEESLRQIVQFSKKFKLRLSQIDRQIAALALDFKNQNKKFVLITDDFALQSIAKKLGVKFDSIIRGKIK